jgi:hypothetical protein
MTYIGYAGVKTAGIVIKPNTTTFLDKTIKEDGGVELEGVAFKDYYACFRMPLIGTLQGKITDSKSNEPLIGATIKLFRNGVLATVGVADMDGNYLISANPDTYDVEMTYIGYTGVKTEGIVIKPNTTTFLDKAIKEDGGVGLEGVVCSLVRCGVPLMERNIPIQTGTIQGKITDSQSNEPLIGATIKLFRNGILITGTQTDLDGNYNLPTEPDTYDVEMTYIGYAGVKTEGVSIKHKTTTFLDKAIEQDGGVELDEVVIKVERYKVPLIEKGY